MAHDKTANHHPRSCATLTHVTVKDHGREGCGGICIKNLWDVFDCVDELVKVLLFRSISRCYRNSTESEAA